MAEFRAIRVVNPRRSKKRRPVARKKNKPVRRRTATILRKKKNPVGAGGVLTIMANPKKKKRNPRRRRNPLWLMRTRNSRRRRNSARRRNPSRGASRRRNPAIVGYSGMGIAKLAIGAGAGAIGTRALTQVVLKDKNQGATGYVANAAVAIGLAMLTGKFLGNDAGAGVLAGGLAATMQRVWDDKRLIPALATAVSATTGAAPSQSAQTVKGLGDISYSDDGLGSLGIYLTAQFPVTTESGAGYGSSTAALPASPAAKATGSDHSQPW